MSAVPGVTFDSPLLAKVAELNKNSHRLLDDAGELPLWRTDRPTSFRLGVSKLLNGQATPADVGKSMTDGLAAWYAPFKK